MLDADLGDPMVAYGVCALAPPVTAEESPVPETVPAPPVTVELEEGVGTCCLCDANFEDTGSRNTFGPPSGNSMQP